MSDAQPDRREQARVVAAARRNLKRQLARGAIVRAMGTGTAGATADASGTHTGANASGVDRASDTGGAAARLPPPPPTTIDIVAAQNHGNGLERVERWFAASGRTPFAFQRAAWRHHAEGRSGLIHAATGTGKTLAAWLGPVIEAIDERTGSGSESTQWTSTKRARRLRVLWITPMRALAADTLASLAAPLAELGLGWRIGLRTGDTPGADRIRQDRDALDAMVTTPESLALLLSRPGQRDLFGELVAVVVDEWHELLGTKRGVQVELALARLKRLAPRLRIWGVSATLGNLDEAERVLLAGRPGVVVAGEEPKTLVIDSLLPHDVMKSPWAGHLGTRAAAQVAAEIEHSGTTLVFTNTRSQAELWYQALLAARPDWAGILGLHHASLSIESRRFVENGLRTGAMKAVVCTSSLDLGVDFAPVDRVIQIGSPKGVARLLQRAGRSGHRPGLPSRISCVPTHALESIEAAAARAAVDDGAIESRRPLVKPIDVLVQHAITIACGEGFAREVLLAEVRDTHAFATLTDAEWDWVIAFAGGGGVLDAYPEYRRIVHGDDGIHRVVEAKLARRHRVQIGTIVSDASVEIRYLRGDRLGSVEENFIARLKPGDAFVIGGKAVSFVRMQEMTALVRRATPRTAVTPRWLGGKMSLSNELARHIQYELQSAAHGHAEARETKALSPLLSLQARHSRVPNADELLAELHATREGRHLCVFPFGGRHVNAALAALVAWRLARTTALTFSMAFNDYGFELLSPVDFALDAAALRAALDPAHAADDIAASVNAAELSRRHFREIARVAGLVFQGYPGEGRSARQLQATSGLFFDVYAEHDPGNPLLEQSRREVLERELELTRTLATLEALRMRTLIVNTPERMTPLALPLVAEQMRNKLSTEQVADRVARMQVAMQKPERRLRAAA